MLYHNLRLVHQLQKLALLLMYQAVPLALSSFVKQRESVAFCEEPSRLPES